MRGVRSCWRQAERHAGHMAAPLSALLMRGCVPFAKKCMSLPLSLLPLSLIARVAFFAGRLREWKKVGVLLHLFFIFFFIFHLAGSSRSPLAPLVVGSQVVEK